MRTGNDILGRRFDRLVAVERIGSSSRGIATWRCQCDCGAEKIVRQDHLTSGNTKSCGCRRRSTFTKLDCVLRDRVLDSDAVREMLLYDPVTGEFTWLAALGCRDRSGTRAGRKNSHGYIEIRIGRRGYKAHRLAWLYVHGEWPSDQIDHINGTRDDNRISNLRLATPAQNGANRKRHRTNTSGVKGVGWYAQTGKWQARIGVNGAQKHLGYFSRIEDAADAYERAANEAFGAFTRVA